MEKFEEQEFVIDKGNGYKFFMDKFLEENPGKTKKDFKPPVVKISAESFRAFLPKEYTCEYEISAQIEEIELLEIFGQKFLKLKVNLEHSKDNEYLYCNIYASETVLKGYEPKVGDGISTVVCMSGYFT